MDFSSEKGVAEDVVWTLLQVALIYVVAFLWFLDGVKKMRVETGTSMLLAEDFAAVNAVVHTAIILVGLWLGQYLKKGERATVAKCVAVCFAFCFLFLAASNASHLQDILPSNILTISFIGAGTMTTWLIVSILVSQLDKQTKGIYPRILMSYCKFCASVVVFAIVFFRFVVVTVWDAASYNGVIPYTEVATFEYSGNFELVFTRVATATHTVVFSLGMLWGVVAARYLQIEKHNIIGVGAVVAIFVGMFLVKSGVETRLPILIEFTSLFFGEYLSINEVLIISINYTAWFTAGIASELTWENSATNSVSPQQLDDREESFSRRQNLDLTIAIFIILGLCLASLPLLWTISLCLLVMGFIGLRAEPNIIPTYTPKYSPRGSHEASLKRWEAAAANFPKTGQRYAVVGGGVLADEIIALLEEREGKTAVVKGDFKNADVVFFIPENGAGYETAVGAALELKKSKTVKRVVMGVSTPVSMIPNKYQSWVVAEAEKVVLCREKSPFCAVSVRVPGTIFGGQSNTTFKSVLDGNRAMFPNPVVVQDFTYVKNAVLAMVQAEVKLSRSPELVGGKVYSVTNEDPATEHAMMSLIMNFRPTVSIWGVPGWVVKLIAVMCVKLQKVEWLLQSVGEEKLDLSRNELGYAPCFTLEEGVQFVIDDWELERAREDVEDAMLELESKKKRVAALEAVLCGSKGKPQRQQKAVQAKQQKRPHTTPTPPQAHTLINPITGSALSQDPSTVARNIFTAVMTDLSTLLLSIIPSPPLVQQDAKGYDIVFPIPAKLSSHLTDFLRKRLNPKLKENPLFKGSCIKVNLQPPPPVETRPPAVTRQHSVYDVQI